MVMLPRYSEHRHSGRLRPHHETSYGWLAGVLALVGVVLSTVSAPILASTTASGQYSVYAVVPAPKVTTAPVITSPTNGQSFTTNPVTVSGTCPEGTLVKIFKNNILAGSVICSPNKLFSVPIDLLVGSNALTAIAFNANDEAGPTSNTVNVTLTVPPGGLGFSTELLLVSSSYYRGTTPGTEIDWPAELIGGQAPYAVSFDWGDGHSDLLTRTAAGSFELKHTYSKPGGYLGNYPLIIRATDAAGHTAYLQLVTIVNQPTGQTVVGIKSNIDLVAAWPLWILLVLLWVSFWLGERREKHKLQKQIEALAAT